LYTGSVAGLPPEAARAVDSELVERARHGDVSAYEEIVRRYQRTAFRVAHLICGSEEDAEEATQDAFVKAFPALPRFRTGASLRPWLLKIVANEARNRRTARSRRAGLPFRLEREAPAGDTTPSPEDAALAATEHRELLDALGRLSRRHREVVACRYLLDLSEAETAAVLRCRRGTVKSRLARGLASLRAELGEEAVHA
jgi:RNA polymerase sigma-70 factor (ECF subfamily)